ncbi:MAG TPA: 2-C-methyl-D-erythritol 4-phosphate cytidylyltransferase [Candidatus Binataceae bacterium]|nr:2-C-methyl-D-erythritol 4-phosphate cytidylyltransferase [Candidatus Binataceae bacterium]
MKSSAIIVAAGSGTRLGSGTPKAFVELGGRSLLWYSLRTIGQVEAIEEAVITVPPGMELQARAQVRAANLEIPVKIVTGGLERQDSVRIALGLTSSEAELVVVHDAARPFATAAMFVEALSAAAGVGGAIVAIPVADTLKRAEQQGTIIATVERAGLWQAQTPQAFRRELLKRAHECALLGQIVATDDADLVERLGATVAVVNGSALNFKITTAADLHLAGLIAASERIA